MRGYSAEENESDGSTGTRLRLPALAAELGVVATEVNGSEFLSPSSCDLCQDFSRAGMEEIVFSICTCSEFVDFFLFNGCLPSGSDL